MFLSVGVRGHRAGLLRRGAAQRCEAAHDTQLRAASSASPCAHPPRRPAAPPTRLPPQGRFVKAALEPGLAAAAADAAASALAGAGADPPPSPTSTVSS